MKFYMYKKNYVKHSSQSKFSIFLKVVEFWFDDFKISLIHYGMIMLMITIF
jgi:hypothetical protein